MPDSFSPNRNYILMATGNDVNTWGINLNSNFSIIDNNLGGTLTLNVGGSSNITLTSSQAQYLIHDLSGVLTGNIQYIFPQAGGFFAINNNTTGSFTLTVKVIGGSGGIVVPQGTTITVYIDASIPAVEAFSGTTYNFIGGTVGGTANALTISQTLPSNFTLNNGTFLTFTPTANNTGSATLNVDGTGIVTLQKITATGIGNLQAGDLFSGVPFIAQYNGSVWIIVTIVYAASPAVNTTNFTLTFAQWEQLQVCTSALTITLDQTSVQFTYYFWTEIMAVGGNVVLTPNAADTITVNGSVLVTGASYTIQQGASGKLSTDANGNWYFYLTSKQLKVNPVSITSSVTYTPSAGMIYCEVWGIGAGGGSPAVAATTGSQVSVSSGGGAGQTVYGIFSAATIGASQTVTIGLGSAGANGGLTSFGTLLTAAGGAVGNVIGPQTQSGLVAPGVAGNGGTIPSGGINILGSDGGPGFIVIGTGFYAQGGPGGSSAYGGSVQGNGLNNGVGTNPGSTGYTFGGGASGGANNGSQSATAAKAGGNGMVFVKEYIAL